MVDALSVPHDVPWQRLVFSKDMFDVRRGDALPPKWRSSLAVYGYALPLEETAAEYPDSRIVYLKVTTSITGWSASEALNDDTVLTPDDWVRAGWDAVVTEGWVSTYWPCIATFTQLAVFPPDPTGVPLDDYPYVMDFEPKKRELYEAVSATGEILSGSAGRLSTTKGSTTTDSSEWNLGGNIGISAGPVSFGASAGVRESHTSQETESTTTDRSTERRETQGRTTQFSQMYQLWNGYHLGTNRALFVQFPRPHIASEAVTQTANNLINGVRLLEGIQEMFLVIHLPRAMPGFCLDAWLDTGHKADLRPRPVGGDFWSSVVLTRRYVTGCARFDGDRVRPVPAPPLPAAPPPIVGEFELDGEAAWDGRRKVAPTQGEKAALADHLNAVQIEARKRLTAFQMSEQYKPRPFHETQAFRAQATPALRATTLDLSRLAKLGYLSVAEETQLVSAGLTRSGELFVDPPVKAVETLVLAVRQRLLSAIVNAIVRKT